MPLEQTKAQELARRFRKQLCCSGHEAEHLKALIPLFSEAYDAGDLDARAALKPDLDAMQGRHDAAIEKEKKRAEEANKALDSNVREFDKLEASWKEETEKTAALAKELEQARAEIAKLKQANPKPEA